MDKRITDIEYFQKICDTSDSHEYVITQLKNNKKTIIKRETVEYIWSKNLERILSCAMGKYDSVHITESDNGEYYVVDYDG